jgi:phosphopantetheine adenylyltransferase
LNISAYAKQSRDSRKIIDLERRVARLETLIKKQSRDSRKPLIQQLGDPVAAAIVKQSRDSRKSMMPLTMSTTLTMKQSRDSRKYGEFLAAWAARQGSNQEIVERT